ncbi:MAG: zinc-dependent metalloprotease, partial [Bdellovibrionia bacterium]
DLVKFETKAKLLKEIPFRGRPNFTYGVKYEIDAKMLRIMKIADEKDIPFQERAYAEKEKEGGKVKIPLMGYPITGLYRIEKAKNGNNEDTATLTEIPETDPKKATHFRIDMNGAQVFEAVEKIDVYPATLFDGDWYFAETIIGTAAGQEENIGSMDAYDQTQRPATKVRFEKTSSLLRAYNVNIDKRLNQNESLNHVSTLEIPVEWTDFEVEHDNGKNGLTEDVVRNDKVRWDKRRYMKIDFDGTKTIQNDAQGSKIVDVEISKNYIGFTILRQQAGVRVKYAFLRATDRKYVTKVSSREDRTKFGFFLTQEAFIRDHTIHRTDDIDSRTYVNRFNPKYGKIVFHFTPSSPKALREIGVKAIAEWNKTFLKAANLKIELDTSFDAQLGDLRYNTINLIESVDIGRGLLGFGPSITDPYTGEIISATANVHVTPIKGNVIGNLRNYIRGGVGQLGPNQLPELALAPPAEGTPDRRLIGGKGLKKVGDEYKLVKIEPTASNKRTRNAEDFGLSVSNFAEDANRVCATEVATLKEIYTKGETQKEVPFLEACALKMLGTYVLPTLIHEMGHNFGLRHNFTASNDAANFYPASETGGRLVRSSSIMDYLSFNEDFMARPGTYDEAAIKFGYADASASQLGQFKFCTDEDVEMRSVDPMCARQDAGVTATEVVQNLIRDYKALYSTTNFRYDRYYSADPERLGNYKLELYLKPMRRYYDQWRLELAQSLGLGSDYLEKYATPAAFEADYQKVKTPRLEDLRTAANLAYQFFKGIVFLPNRYCVVKKNGETD